jgi:hypothetical protein
MKTCKDYEYTGVNCCPCCHNDMDGELVTIQISGEDAYVCCDIARFFYPDGSWKERSKTGQWSARDE